MFCAPAVSGTMMSDATRELLAVPFGRAKAETFREARDVDRALSDIGAKYPHFGKASRDL